MNWFSILEKNTYFRPRQRAARAAATGFRAAGVLPLDSGLSRREAFRSMTEPGFTGSVSGVGDTSGPPEESSDAGLIREILKHQDQDSLMRIAVVIADHELKADGCSLFQLDSDAR